LTTREKINGKNCRWFSALVKIKECIGNKVAHFGLEQNSVYLGCKDIAIKSQNCIISPVQSNFSIDLLQFFNIQDVARMLPAKGDWWSFQNKVPGHQSG
jgi:hypothetical protein